MYSRARAGEPGAPPTRTARRLQRAISAALPTLLTALLLVGCTDDLGTPGPPPPGPELADRIARPAETGAVHLVRMIQRGDQYAFDPAEVNVRPGDVVRFVMTGGQPESVAFDPVEAMPERSGEYVRQRGLHLGVLMTDPGQTYDVSFEGAPPGEYPFVSVPHAVRGMRGVVTVEVR